MQVMEVVQMDAGKARDSSDGRTVSSCECRCGRKAVAIREVINNTVDTFGSQFATPVGCALRFAEFGAARAAS